MIEVLFAIMILAMGLIMVAAIYPVAVKWTEQDSEQTIGRIIASNALGIIETQYTQSSLSSITSTTPLEPLPTLPSLVERAYAFGTPTPYPDTYYQSGYAAANPNNSLYFWTALIRPSPSQANQPQPGYDLYILVFRKGDIKNLWTTTSSGSYSLLGSGGVNAGTDTNGTSGVYGVPVVATLPAGDLNTYPNTAAFPIGSFGIDETTGAVFRKTVITIGGTDYAWRSDLPIPTSTPSYSSSGTPQNDPVAFVPPADGGTASPLIYIYTTTFTPQ